MDMKSDNAESGRADLAGWESAQPRNFYETDQHLQNILEFHWGSEKLSRHAARLSKFGGEAATVVDQAVRRDNQPENLPRLDRFNAVGERTEDVVHSVDHHLAGRYIYGSGMMSVYAEPENNLLAQALFYISSYNGESGHNCPVACTAGVIKTLQAEGSDDLKAAYLPRLLDSDYDNYLHGAQFLTEVQGGSDVGLNSVTARPLDESGKTWLINGEKWFCSNVTADLALITARPDGAAGGTKGLGLFLVPKRLADGRPNGIFIRRLKDKLGTKSMATAEVDFKDAVAYLVGEPGRGFQQVMDYVVNTSRLYNAVGSAAAARRACVIAWTYAKHRRAFGAEIKNFPLIQETLAEMRSITMALTSGSLCLARLRDEIESGRADDASKQFFRLAVNLNKYRSSLSATDIIRRAIEVLGGNGAMENFSVLPRLLRDSIIFEAWEGAHNTLLAQAVRDIQRHRLHENFCSQLAGWFGSLRDSSLKVKALARLDLLKNSLDALSSFDELTASIAFKPLADQMMWMFYLACLARESEWEDQNRKPCGKPAVFDWLWDKFIEKNEEKDLSKYLQQIAQISEVA